MYINTKTNKCSWRIKGTIKQRWTVDKLINFKTESYLLCDCGKGLLPASRQTVITGGPKLHPTFPLPLAYIRLPFTTAHSRPFSLLNPNLPSNEVTFNVFCVIFEVLYGFLKVLLKYKLFSQ